MYKNIFQRGAAFKGKEKTINWALSRAVSQEAAIKKLFGKDFQPLSELYQQELSDAYKLENECPIKMGGAGALELLYEACEYAQAQEVVETGVAYGWSTLAVLASISKRNGMLYSSDMPYLGQDGDRYVGYVVPEKWRKFWKLFRYADRESLPKIFGEADEFDVVHYDSDKAYDAMRWAYDQLYKHLRKGGVFLSDDISDNSAFQDFCEQNNIEPTVVDFKGKYVGVFVK